MARRLKWGILGTGGIAKLFTRDILGEGLAVSAVGSRTREGAEAFGESFGIARRHGSYEALLADPEVDIVYVSTPHPFHHSNALAALRAGKHVLLEKPFTINAREAKELIDTARARGLFIMEAMWTRFLPTFERLREIVAAGTIGEIGTVLADHNQYLPIEKASRLHLPELGGGALLDLGVYPITLAQLLLGAPAGVRASATLTERKVDRQTSLILSYASGARACLQCGMSALGPNRAFVIGSLGRIEIDSVWYNQSAFTLYSREGEIVERYAETVPNRGMQYQAFEAESRVLAGELESPLMSHEATLQVMAIMDEARAQVGVKYPGE